VNHGQTGFAYAEVMIAALILALCAVPAANAIKNGLDAATVSRDKALELRCVRNRMEAVLAEPYFNLNAAAEAAGSDGITSYSLPKADGCDARTVKITLHRLDGATLVDLPAAPQTVPPTAPADEQRRTALLKVQVSMDRSTYSFATMVAR
jgi:Tfp pilus assembly protein PilV